MSQPPTCPPGQHLVTTYTCVPDVGPCPDLPTDGRPQPLKNANKDAKTWTVVPMKDDPALFKVVDDKNINVADQFHTKAAAEQYVAHYVCVDEPDPNPCPAGQHRDENGVCVPDVIVPPPPGGASPYPPKGTPLSSTIRRAVRHYASGKPDDETIEANVKSIQFDNYQFVVDVGVPTEMEHDDNVSLKVGGTHMGSGWFDNGVGIYEGNCCLGTEPEHPSTHTCVIKGPKIGDIRGKRIKVACIYRKQENKVELWTNLGTSGWVKQMEAVDVDGFNPNSDVNEAQLRIDGFKKGSQEGKPPEPEIFSAFVTQI